MAHDVPAAPAQPALDNFESLLLDPVPVGGRAGQPRWQDGFELKHLALGLGSGADDGNELTGRQAQYPVLTHRCPHQSMPHPTPNGSILHHYRRIGARSCDVSAPTPKIG